MLIYRLINELCTYLKNWKRDMIYCLCNHRVAIDRRPTTGLAPATSFFGRDIFMPVRPIQQ